MSTKEELLLRALNSSNMNGSPSFTHEDLSDLITFLTPRDVPLFQRLARGRAYQSLHEWTERTQNAPLTAAYNGESALPSAVTNTGARRNNKVMQIGIEAVATEFIQAMDTVGKSQGLDAFALEMEEKMINLMRAIEYYIWNGNIANTSPQEMDGIISLSAGFTTQSNGGSAAALTENNLNTLISNIYTAGGDPRWIFARPLVCQRIANFNADKIRFTPGGGAGGVNEGAFNYVSPFGYNLEVIPVRGDFLPSGGVYVLDPSKIKLCPMGSATEIMIKDLPIQKDDVARKLLKSYLTLEVRALTYHGKLTNVLDSL